MSIEDINYMKENSIKQAYTFIIDSSERDRNMFPNPNNYVVNFSTPFKNIIGMEIIDASIPRAMYTIDVDNNEFYYYIGNDTGTGTTDGGMTDGIIEKGIQIQNDANLILQNWNYTSNIPILSYLELSGDRYGILENSINLYNIYNNTAAIGGSAIGITFHLCLQAIIEDANKNKEYSILDFSYNHTFSLETDIIFRNISVDIAKSTNNTFVLSFTIGERKESIFNIPMNDYVNIFWSIQKSTWNIGIFDATLNTQIAYKEFLNCDELYNVFFTKKYIGKKHASVSDVSDVSGESGTNGWEDNLLRLKGFKLYNTPMMTLATMVSALSVATDVRVPVWYKMDEVVNNAIINKGTHATIEYTDVFKKILISPGDYTFRTYITKYDELIKNNDMEIMFKETSTPPELTNLIDIYSKAPLIVDMKRTTLAENLGFDLFPTKKQEDRYISKGYTTVDSVLAKMFYSRANASYDADVSVNNKYIITSPGIVYFIGNKYIIMRCPEIEEHLYRSLSYSKNTLGIAKIRVDSIGINSEKLTITKIPVREFHPIGKLSRMSLRFETSKGSLYDFKGLNHNIIFAVFYYEPIQKNIPKNSILNPEYKMNYLDYLYKQEEIEGDSDDGNEDSDDFSRDNIDDYKIKENLYSERGVQLQQSNTYYQNNNITDAIIEEDDEDDDEGNEDDDEGDEEYN
jgi:hypothetical protein